MSNEPHTKENAAARLVFDRVAADRVAADRVATDRGLAWIRLDDPAKSVNTLSTRLFEWLVATMEQLEAEPPNGLVILSDKPDHFMAGADIEELKRLSGEEEVYELLQQAHALLGRVAALPYPVLAAVHGACLGGGLELALACDAILATDHAKTRLGFPEVQLGIFPGMGGTQRLPRRIGAGDALDLILTGRQVSARRAHRLGLVDEICPPQQLEERAAELVAAGLRGRRRGPVGLGRRLTHLLARSPLRRLVFERARSTVRRRTGGHYPAPVEAIRVIEEGLRRPLGEGLDLEARAFSRLVVSDQARTLMSIFFMKNDVEARAALLAERHARPLGTVAILGAGFMGSGIAQVLAHRGLEVVMKDRDQPSLDRGLAFCRTSFEELETRGRLSAVDAEAARGRIRGSLDYADLGDADFVIEAVFEDLDVKHAVLRDLEAVAPERLVFASNTSAIPIARIAAASRRPAQVVGLHFFSPVHRMPLVEVIRTDQSSDEAVATAVRVALRMGKTPIVVRDGPGFFTTRVLAPFVNEAAWCLSQGARIEQIDRALTAWGWPVGAMALLDEVGLDVGAHAAAVMVEEIGSRLEPPAAFDRLIESGRLGRKSGRGFYRYGEGDKRVDEEIYALLDWQAGAIDDEEIAERCWLQMLNEVARCLDEGLVGEVADADLGVIFGFGFPPFRGGILRCADRVGLTTVVDRLTHYAERYGERLQPAELLRRMAAANRRFYEEG